MGSLLRSPALEGRRRDHEDGRIDAAALAAAEDEAVRLQEAGRLEGITDGSSTLEGNDVSAEQQGAKLRLCAEVAREVWGGL